MPAPGDQHHNAPANPFEEAKPRISEYTARELAVLQGRLQQQLGPEFISTRKGPGGKNVHYIASEKVIGLANDVFGFNGWSSTIRDIQVDFVDENVQTRRVDVGLSVIVRVTLRDGSFHEDIGYGHIENCSGKAAAFEKAKKEGTTDALKRALRNFGNVLGNCVYDKDYLSKVTKIKIRPTRFAEENLHRHTDFAPSKSEVPKDANAATHDKINAPEIKVEVPNQLEPNAIIHEDGEGLTSADFDEVDLSFSDLDHPDAIPEMMSLKPQPQPNLVPQNTSMGQQPPNVRPPAFSPSRPALPQEQTTRQQSYSRPTNGTNGSRNIATVLKTSSTTNITRPTDSRMTSGSASFQNGRAGSINQPQQRTGLGTNQVGSTYQRPDAQASVNNNVPSTSLIPGEGPIPTNAPLGFVPGRNAESAQQANGNVPAFNPHTKSPSIRRTAGFDHTKTASVKRTSLPWTSSNGGVVNGQSGPPLDSGTKRIGAPLQHNSPLANRGQFKPVGKRPAEVEPTQKDNQQGIASNTAKNLGQPQRQVLDDVTTSVVNSAAPGIEKGPPEPKKPRLGGDASLEGANTSAAPPSIK